MTLAECLRKVKDPRHARGILYTIYALPNHQDGILRVTKKDAETNDEEFDGKTTE